MGAGGSVEVEVAGPARRVLDAVATVPGVGAATVLRDDSGVVIVRLEATPDQRPQDRPRPGPERPGPVAHRPRRGPAGVDLPATDAHQADKESIQ